MRAIDFVQAIWATGVTEGLSRCCGAGGYQPFPLEHGDDIARFRATPVRIGGVVVAFGEDDTIRVRHHHAHDAASRNAMRAAGRPVRAEFGTAVEYTESKDITLPADATLADLHAAIAEVAAYRCARVNHIPDGSVEAYDTETGKLVGQYWLEG